MNNNQNIRLALPKGRMQAGVFDLLRDAGLPVAADGRDYRPRLRLPGIDAKILKPQSIVEMLSAGSRDLGFAGADWVAELGSEAVEVLDMGLNPVSIVAAAPASLLEDGQLPERPLVLASEYRRLSMQWIERRGIDARFVRSYGATEVLPPEDADCIIDNSATGSTLRDNGLKVIDTIMTSSTRLYASQQAWAQPAKRKIIDDLLLHLSAVLEARRRVLLELNVAGECVEAVVNCLPCMREPTLSPLHGEAGFAIKAAVPRSKLWELIPELKELGGTDLVVTELSQIVE
ncbi:MAG: ATP phosphoribosyltransferase [Planctomycetota bacterium]|jgi:ATP phosphoribosyltransferase